MPPTNEGTDASSPALLPPRVAATPPRQADEARCDAGRLSARSRARATAGRGIARVACTHRIADGKTLRKLDANAAAGDLFRLGLSGRRARFASDLHCQSLAGHAALHPEQILHAAATGCHSRPIQESSRPGLA